MTEPEKSKLPNKYYIVSNMHDEEERNERRFNSSEILYQLHLLISLGIWVVLM